ncbi:MAG: hypothetical protein HQK63_17630 [Desulfamplus sp.]|nr:hypothetical protein [Desulfamplus sp.]
MFGKNVINKVFGCKNTQEIVELVKSLLEYVKKPKYDETSETDEKGVSEDTKTDTKE